MAVLTGPRIRTNNVFGTVSDNPLTNSATTLNSAGLANLAAVSSAHAVLVLDPLRAAGAPEIVIVTAHTGSATSATITRGAYGTSARQHAQGTLWVHAPTVDDLIRICTSSTRPSDPYEGQLIYETDTDRFSGHDGTNWMTVAQLGAWNSYTPTDTNVTVGNGTRLARYRKEGRSVDFFWKLTLGSSSAFGAGVSIGIPFAAAANGAWQCGVYMLDSGTQDYSCGARINGGSSIARITLGITTGTAITGGGGVTSTVPFTWAQNDVLEVSGTYEAAS